MSDSVDALAVYLHLARASELRRRWLVRDRLLLLSAVRAHGEGLDELAEHCRRRILTHNPGHLAGRFASMAEACEDEAFLGLCRQVERQFPQEKTEHMLQSLGIELGGARATYATPREYLESILGPSPLPEASMDRTERPAPDRASGNEETAADEEAESFGDDLPAAIEGPLDAASAARRERLELRGVLLGLAALSAAIAGWWAWMLR